MNLKQEGLQVCTLKPDDRTALIEILCDYVKNPEATYWWDDATPELVDDLIANRWPELTALAIKFEDTLCGIIQYEIEEDPKYRHASIDIALADAYQGQGYGPKALKLVMDFLHAQNIHRIMIDPDARNTRAIKVYEKLGFRHVGRIPKAVHSSATNSWEDIALMAHTVEPTILKQAIRGSC